MKNIIKSILAITLMTGFVSCEDEQELLFLTPEATFQILSPESGEGAVLNPETPLNPALSLTWEDADYGTPTEVNYIVQVDKSGDNFDTPLDVTSTTKTYVTIASDVLNSAASAVGLSPFSEGGLEVRITATVGTTASQATFSNVITYLVTPYTTELPQLALPGNHQGWNPGIAPRIAASAFGETDYEGYVWLDGGFKFLAPQPDGNFNWGTQDWGDDGSFSGIMKDGSGETDCSSPAGYYRVKANTTTLTYSTEPTTWGIIGGATPGGWDASTALTYNATTKVWEGTVALSAGEFKFRANNAWSINLGGDPDDDGSMNYDGPNLSVDAAGSYSIVLDLSKGRQYTYSATKL